MFQFASSFNQPLSDGGSTGHVCAMFWGASAFDQDSTTGRSTGSRRGRMFVASSFNHPLSADRCGCNTGKMASRAAPWTEGGCLSRKQGDDL